MTIVFEPGAWNTGILFDDTSAGAVPSQYISAIEKAVRITAQTGVLAGFPTIDFTFTLVDGKYHDIDSSALAFEIAAKACFRQLRQAGSPKILEPVMAVEITTPRAHTRDITNDLKNRRGNVKTIEPRGSANLITASVPLKAMLGYKPPNHAQFTMQYERHQEVPPPSPPDDLFPKAAAIRAA